MKIYVSIWNDEFDNTYSEMVLSICNVYLVEDGSILEDARFTKDGLDSLVYIGEL